MSRLYMKYFTLKPGGFDIWAEASRAAMHRYAEVIQEHDPTFALALSAWASKEAELAISNQPKNSMEPIKP